MAGDDYAGQTGQPDDEDERRRRDEFIVRSALKPTIPAKEPALDRPNVQGRNTTGATPTNALGTEPEDPYGQHGYPDHTAPARPQLPKLGTSGAAGTRTMRGDSGHGEISKYGGGDISSDNEELIRSAGGMSGATTTPRMPNLSSSSRPNIPTPRAADVPSPDINANSPFTPQPNTGRQVLGLKGVLPSNQLLGLNRGVQPARPDVMPTRADFPERKLPGWEKALGIAAAPFVPGVSAAILTGPRREAQRQYEAASQDWTLGQQGQERQARIEETQARTRALNNPPPKEGQTPEETTLADLMSGGPGGGPQLNEETGKPYTRLEAYTKVQQAKTGAAQGAKQPPLTPDNISQINDAHTLRFQQLNPGKPLPAALTLRPGATQQDYERIHQNLTSMEGAAGVQAQRESTNAARAESRADREEREALQPVVAMDPKTKQRIFTSMGDARKNGLQITTLKPNEEKESELNAQLNDVQMNTSRYRVALNGVKTPFSKTDVLNATQIISSAPAQNFLLGQLGFPMAMDQITQGDKAKAWNALSPEKQEAVIGYLRQRGSAIAYQKILTNQGRTSKEGLDIELQNMPSPILGATVANKQLDAFQENIDVAAQRAVKLPWMETAKDVRARIEKQ